MTPSKSCEVQLAQLQVLGSDQLRSFMEPFWYPIPIHSSACPSPSVNWYHSRMTTFYTFSCQTCLNCVGYGSLSKLRCAMSPSSLCYINRLLSTACDGEQRTHSPGEKRYCLKCPHLCKGSGMERGSSKLHFMVWYQDGSGLAVLLVEWHTGAQELPFHLGGDKTRFPCRPRGYPHGHKTVRHELW